MTAYPDQDEIITQPNSGEYSIEPLKTSAKLRVLVELIDGITKTHPKDKIIIASHYTQTLDVIEAVLMDRNRPCDRMDGSTSLEKRSSVIRQLNSALQTEMMAKILLISSKTGGIGTNLVGANRLIMFDLSWNPVHDLQTAARIHRPGQKAACVYIYRLLCTGSVDEWIWARQEQKISVSRLVLHDNDRDNEKDKSADQTLEFADDGKLENNFDGVLAGLADSSCLMHSRSGCKCGGHPSTTPSITGNKDLLLDQPFHIDLSDNEATKQVRWLCENFDLSLAHLSTKLISFVYARKSSAS
jgi:DNA repair and recombination protein RAD54B